MYFTFTARTYLKWLTKLTYTWIWFAFSFSISGAHYISFIKLFSTIRVLYSYFIYSSHVTVPWEPATALEKKQRRGSRLLACTSRWAWVRACSAPRCGPTFRSNPATFTWITAPTAPRRSSSRRRVRGMPINGSLVTDCDVLLWDMYLVQYNLSS